MTDFSKRHADEASELQRRWILKKITFSKTNHQKLEFELGEE